MSRIAQAAGRLLIGDAYRFALMRCHCKACERLDRRYPDEGYQLALFEYRRDVPRLTDSGSAPQS